jgi:mannonate dehydratase
MNINRRKFIKNGTSLAALSAIGIGTSDMAGLSGRKNSHTSTTSGLVEAYNEVEWPIPEGPNTPKLCAGIPRNAEKREMRMMKQIGITHVLMGGGPIPWKEDELRATMDRFKEEGLTVLNMMIGGFTNTIYGRKGRDEEIEKVQASIRAAGATGLPIVEYNFYADRLIEGYYAAEGRGGAGHTAFDYEPVKDLPQKPEVGIHSSDELWANITYFLKAVIPVAEKAGVRMALHPNDPPVPVSHGSAQIMATLDDWKRLIEILDSPSNGITFDPGVAREMGEDPVAVCRYFGTRDRINHAHYRNVLVDMPYLKYTEVFPDEGQVDMFNVMQEMVRNGYRYGIYPEHPRALDHDREHPGAISGGYPGGGGFTGLTFNVAYARAMLQASLSMQKNQG